MPPAKGIRWGLWAKVLGGGGAVAVGGPMFTAWLIPDEEELRSRYNPDLRKRSLENREERQQEFDDFVGMLKNYSKSDKHIWDVAREADERRKQQALEAGRKARAEAAARKEEMRKELGLSSEK